MYIVNQQLNIILYRSTLYYIIIVTSSTYINLFIKIKIVFRFIYIVSMILKN